MVAAWHSPATHLYGQVQQANDTDVGLVHMLSQLLRRWRHRREMSFNGPPYGAPIDAPLQQTNEGSCIQKTRSARQRLHFVLGCLQQPCMLQRSVLRLPKARITSALPAELARGPDGTTYLLITQAG